MKPSWREFSHLPIQFHYDPPNGDFLNLMKENGAAIDVPEIPHLILKNTYYKNGIEGSIKRIKLRTMAVRQIQQALALLQPEYGFILFDGYRSRATQYGLFKEFSLQIRKEHPEWDEKAVFQEARKYASHPDETSRFEVPPHNTGGAIDIGLTKSGILLDMGTGFDELSSASDTDYFEKELQPGFSSERWEMVRTNRRILFYALRSVGFVNYPHEWWHYDLGDCIWSQELGMPWVYGSME